MSDFFFDSSSAKVSRPKILSSSVILKLSTPNFGTDAGVFPADPEIEIGEIDNFSARKNFTVVKSFKPFGMKFERKIVEDSGWELSFSAGKVDWTLAYLFYMNEIALSGHDESNFIGDEQLVDQLYNKPMFSIKQTIIHYDGTTEAYEWRDVTLLSFDQDITEDNAVITEKVTAFSPQRRVVSALFDPPDRTKITSRIVHILETIQKNNRS